MFVGFFLLYTGLEAQPHFEVRKVEPVEIDPYAFNFVGQFPLKLRLTYSKGKIEKKVISKKRDTWIAKHFMIEGVNAKYKAGWIFFDPLYTRADGCIELNVRPKANPKEAIDLQIPFPRLESLALVKKEPDGGVGNLVTLSIQLVFEDGHRRNLRNIGDQYRTQMPYAFPNLADFEIILEEPFDREEYQFSYTPGIQSPSDVPVKVRYLPDTSISGESRIPVNYKLPQSVVHRGGKNGKGDRHSTPVDIFVKLIVKEGEELLWIQTQTEYRTHETLINPSIGRLAVDCRGLNGTDGSDGWDGSDGSTNPPTDGCDGDHGENGEDGGDGALVTLYVDEESKFLISCIEVDNAGGRGGEGGDGGTGGSGGPGKMDGCDGWDGSDGTPGREGPPVEVRIVSHSKLEQMMRGGIDKIRE